MSYGACLSCGNSLTDGEIFRGDWCEACREREEAEAQEAAYEDARWDLAHEHGRDYP